MTIYYKKVGRRYKPVSVYDSDIVGALPKGAHLIVVDSGMTSTRFNVEPDYIAVLAALKMCEDKVLEAIRNAAEFKPTKELEGRHLKAFEAYKEIAGPDLMLILHGSSHMDIVRAMEDALIKHIGTHHD